MKVVLINLGAEKIIGLDKAFANDLVETVEGNSAEEVAGDTKQFIETWTPDLLVIAETPDSSTGNGMAMAAHSRAAHVIEMLRKEKLLNQPAIFVGNAQDAKSLELLQAGAQALVPVSLNSTTRAMSVSSQLLQTQAINLTNLAKGQATKDFKLGAITILRDSHEVFIYGSKIHLTGQETKIFTTLILAGGRIVNKEGLYTQLYSYDSDVEPKIIDVFICKLRDKLDTALKPLGHEGRLIIGTAWGRGYYVELGKVPGLEGHSRSEALLGASHAAQPIVIAQTKQLSPPSAANGKSAAQNGDAPHPQLKDRTPAEERTLPAKPAHTKSDTLSRIKGFLVVADFQERDADIEAYANLVRRAIQEGHTTQELFGLFANSFKPMWRGGGIVDLKAFTYHVQNPERLRFYRIDREAVAKIPIAAADIEMAPMRSDAALIAATAIPAEQSQPG